ncbi:YjcQ family protein [Priestia aryabhattai]|uniref:YjcQ family protein n=1 Tax=Priestia aryabhattai TaxID=412384 RepID=UPI002E1C44EC|nr:YjcQ family protein [Priestia aryabhattai]
MKLDLKQKVLVAIYTEYQKDVPEMDNITQTLFDIDESKFIIALKKLENEDKINGLNFAEFAEGTFLFPNTMSQVMMTNHGMDYVENVLGIQPTLNGLEKVKEVASKVGGWGFEQLKDFAVKVTTEMIKSNF